LIRDGTIAIVPRDVREIRPSKEIRMTFESLKPLLVGAAVATSLAFVAACSGSSSSMIPTAPTAATSSAAAGANFSPNPGEDPCTTDPTLPECQPPGIPCSPGYWKNHESEFAAACALVEATSTNTSLDTCGELFTALTCKGSDASCLRHAAAALLNAATGCTESD
jgi:hypothetical protein